MEDDATCPLCVELFVDPVSLPCGHGFCRKCLQSLVDHKSTGQTAGKSSVDGNTSIEGDALSCPLCRKEVELGPCGVDELDSSQHLADLVKKCQLTRNCSVNIPLCDMCENEKEKAANYCVNCLTLYCSDCLKALHPQRGPFGRHQVILVEEYLRQDLTQQTADNGCPDKDDRPVTLCTDHKEPLSLFCATCDRPICTGCFSQHDDHKMNAILTAYNKRKVPLEDLTQSCRKQKTGLQELQSQLISTQKDVQTKMRQEIEGIRAVYERCLKNLQRWQESETDKVEKTCDKLTTETLALLKAVNLRIEEADHFIQSSTDLISGDKGMFLRDSNQLVTRFQSHTSDSGREMVHTGQKLKDLRSTMSNYAFQSCFLTASKYIQARRPKFVRTTSGDILISEDGSEASSGSQGAIVYTDGRIRAGLHYWELQYHFSQFAYWTCTVGLVQDDRADSGKIGEDRQFLGVRVEGRFCKYRYNFICAGRSLRQTTLGIPEKARFGFLVDVTSRLLSVIDCDKNSVLYTFQNIDVSKPLIPAVQFGDVTKQTFRLIHRDVDFDPIMPFLEKISYM